jgi:hypothetical protein
MPRARLASATAHIGLCARSHTVRIEIANHNVWMSSEVLRQLIQMISEPAGSQAVQQP